jgi:hypothetical protein
MLSKRIKYEDLILFTIGFERNGGAKDASEALQILRYWCVYHPF